MRYLFTKSGYNKFREKVRKLELKLSSLQSQSGEAAEVGGNQYHDNSSYEFLVVEIRGADFLLNRAVQILNQAAIVEPPQTFERVCIGSLVKFTTAKGKTLAYGIVGYGEGDISTNLIEYQAPLAQLLIGKSVGDSVEGHLGGKRVEYEILQITGLPEEGVG